MHIGFISRPVLFNLPFESRRLGFYRAVSTVAQAVNGWTAGNAAVYCGRDPNAPTVCRKDVAWMNADPWRIVTAAVWISGITKKRMIELPDENFERDPVVPKSNPGSEKGTEPAATGYWHQPSLERRITSPSTCQQMEQMRGKCTLIMNGPQAWWHHMVDCGGPTGGGVSGLLEFQDRRNASGRIYPATG